MLHPCLVGLLYSADQRLIPLLKFTLQAGKWMAAETLLMRQNNMQVTRSPYDQVTPT